MSSRSECGGEGGSASAWRQSVAVPCARDVIGAHTRHRRPARSSALQASASCPALTRSPAVAASLAELRFPSSSFRPTSGDVTLDLRHRTSQYCCTHIMMVPTLPSDGVEAREVVLCLTERSGTYN